jgi:hypothetical protein
MAAAGGDPIIQDISGCPKSHPFCPRAVSRPVSTCFHIPCIQLLLPLPPPVPLLLLTAGTARPAVNASIPRPLCKLLTPVGTYSSTGEAQGAKRDRVHILSVSE